jgi:hypothetical protein
MFDSQCDVAALVYGQGQDPDPILGGFAADLNAGGHLAAGLIQLGHRSRDAALSATLLPTGESVPLFRDIGTAGGGRRLDLARLGDAAERIAHAIDQGADIAIVNRFGRQECEGKGLAPLISRALAADIPVLIAVPGHRFADWIRFTGGMTVKLPCTRRALDEWWGGVSARNAQRFAGQRPTVCEIIK